LPIAPESFFSACLPAFVCKQAEKKRRGNLAMACGCRQAKMSRPGRRQEMAVKRLRLFFVLANGGFCGIGHFKV
jgi:hypothetical protein